MFIIEKIHSRAQDFTLNPALVWWGLKGPNKNLKCIIFIKFFFSVLSFYVPFIYVFKIICLNYRGY